MSHWLAYTRKRTIDMASSGSFSMSVSTKMRGSSAAALMPLGPSSRQAINPRAAANLIDEVYSGEWPRVRQAYDARESPLRAGVGGGARAFVHRVQHGGGLDALRRECQAIVVTRAAFGAFAPGARRGPGIAHATRGIRREARVAR